jgi:hypothetical protein
MIGPASGAEDLVVAFQSLGRSGLMKVQSGPKICISSIFDSG